MGCPRPRREPPGSCLQRLTNAAKGFVSRLLACSCNSDPRHRNGRPPSCSSIRAASPVSQLQWSRPVAGPRCSRIPWGSGRAPVRLPPERKCFEKKKRKERNNFFLNHHLLLLVTIFHYVFIFFHLFSKSKDVVHQEDDAETPRVTALSEPPRAPHLPSTKAMWASSSDCSS